MKNRKNNPIKNLIISRFCFKDSVSELTKLLNVAYKRLADMGFRYVATYQDDQTTLSRIKKGECYIGKMDDKLVGTITYYPPNNISDAQYYNRPGVSYFGQFAVLPALHGKGIGSQLLEYAEQKAKSDGATEIALDTAEGAQHLIEFYENKGYVFAEFADWEMMNYRSTIMRKQL